MTRKEPSAPGRVAREVRLRGRVQGVGFRHSARTRAEALGLVGWVRNLPDGAVEVRVEGRPAAVDELVDWLGTGPPAARVEGREVREVEPRGASSFEVRAS